MRDDDTDIEALPASVSFRFVSFRFLPVLWESTPIAISVICCRSLFTISLLASFTAGAVAFSCLLLIWASLSSPSGLLGEVEKDLLRSSTALSDLKRFTTILRPVDWARAYLGQFGTSCTRKSRSVSLRAYVLLLRSESDKFECTSEVVGLISIPFLDFSALDYVF